MSLSNEKISVITIILTFLACMFFLTMTNSDFAKENTIKEGIKIEQVLGTETAIAVTQQADKWFYDLIEKINIEERTIRHFVPTEEEKARSRGMENMGDWLFPIVEDRVVGTFDMIFWIFKRIALMLIWLPLLVPLCLVATFDGILQRRIKLENFAMASPLKQRIGTLGSVFCSCALMLWFFLPYAIDPHVAPALLGIIAMLIGLSVGNMQKRL